MVEFVARGVCVCVCAMRYMREKGGRVRAECFKSRCINGGVILGGGV